jgi:5-methylcytosine-specific restriction endonuclease McrA
MPVIKNCEYCGLVFKNVKRQEGRGKYCSKECGYFSRMKKSDGKYLGKKFGRLTVLSRVASKSETKYLCRCDCGKEVERVIHKLTCGETVSCGCYRRGLNRDVLHKEGLKSVALIELGSRFGRWVVLRRLGSNKHGSSMYECLCDCGEFGVVTRSGLISGLSKSCGCYHKEISAQNLRKAVTTHGLSKERWYLNWQKRRRNKIDRSTWTREMETILFELQPSCVVCGSSDRLAVDHVIPVSKGGKLEPGNVAVLCKSHNSSKHDKDLNKVDFSDKIILAAENFLDAWNSRIS